MPFPMVVCIICDQNVSKRSTLSLEVLGGGGGRACRTHKEVSELAERYRKIIEEQKRNREFGYTFAHIQVTALVRVIHTLYETPLELIYLRLKTGGLPETLLQKVREEVSIRGARMSLEEMHSSLVAYSSLVSSVRENLVESN